MFNTCALSHGQRVQLQHGDSPCPVDHDMTPERIRTGLTPSLTGGSRTCTRVPAEEGGTLSCAPSAVADAGNGGPLNWPPSPTPSRGRGAAHAWRSADSRGSCGSSLHEHPWNTHCTRRDCHAVL